MIHREARDKSIRGVTPQHNPFRLTPDRGGGLSEGYIPTEPRDTYMGPPPPCQLSTSVYIYNFIAEAPLKVAEKGGEGGEERRRVRGKGGIGEGPAAGGGGWQSWAGWLGARAGGSGSGSEGKRSFNMYC